MSGTWVAEEHDQRLYLPAKYVRSEVTETAAPKVPASAGFLSDIPMGGTTVWNPGGTAGAATRREFADQLYGAYMSCSWASACIDVISRTVTAGGLEIVPDDGDEDATPPPEVVAIQQLFEYVNPRENMRQLLRGIVTDLLIFGDAFVEIVYVAGRPVALYSLDSPSMVVIADEHGSVSKYVQNLDPFREAEFTPDEVLHFTLDSPRGGIYGIGGIQKALLPITAWLFTAGLIKETMRKGNPPKIHFDYPLEVDRNEMEIDRQKWIVKNLGIANVGNPYFTKGGAHPTDLKANQISEYLDTLNQKRDEIIASFGVPPRKLSIAEPGQLGGTGEGASSDKTFRVNTCGPLAELILEVFNFGLAFLAFGIDGWSIKIGEVDWRDDQVIENIRDQRLRNGSWCVDPETEILTAEGWKSHEQLTVGEDVLTLNHETGESEWHPLKEVATFELTDAPMVEMTSRSHSSVTTPNHRWPVKRLHQWTSTTDRTREWTTSETMYAQDQIITAAPSADRPFAPVVKDDLVELVAWFWTEGHAPEGAGFCFITQKKSDGKERIERCLRSVFGEPYEVTRYRRKDGSANAWTVSERHDGVCRYRIATPHGETVLQYIDRDLHAPTMEFLLSLTPDQLNLFIEASLMADGVNSKLAGKTGQQVLTQKRREAAERFQIACVLAGRPAHMRVRIRNDQDGRPNPNEPCYVVNVGTTDTVQPKRYGGYREFTYSGLVWCPVTTNHSWMARRDGKVFFTGNTLNRYRQEIDEEPVEGGDDAVLVDRQNLVLWSDLAALSHAQTQAAGAGIAVPGLPMPDQLEVEVAAKGGQQSKDTAQESGRQPRSPIDEEAALVAAWTKDYQQRRKRALKELPKVPA